MIIILDREYYAQVKKRLLLEEGKQYRYSFSKEDFYVYMISHEYKHYSSSGMGIRALADCFVFLKAEEQNLDLSCLKTSWLVTTLCMGKMNHKSNDS